VNKNQGKMGKVANDDRVDWSPAWALFPGDVAYVWHASWYTSAVQASLESVGFEIRCEIIWAKDRFALSRAVITTGSMSLVGMPFGRARAEDGWALGINRRSGTSMPATMTVEGMARKNLWSACDARSRIMMAMSMIHSLDLELPFAPPNN
jgi:hypothetical protein